MLTLRKEVLTRLLIKIEMAMIDLIVQLSAIVEYRHITEHTVRLGVCLPYCIDGVRVLLTMDGLETASVWG